ncbi:CpsD/CapB family tyrosine-protein kinase [Bacillus songklensis]|uniref:non-specific protein-tyrosine kinase n=1 Tax=Bacillus songklensis TaxID=1069116 RepID=A0ABV8B4H5_9BACI
MTLKKRERGLISSISPASTISEQYRAIRTNIHFSSVDHKYRTLLITSPGLGEGKSTTTTNLAISMVQQGAKVLVIDADLRKPTLHTTFNIDNTTGLANILRRETTLTEAVNRTEIEGLEIITSGPVPSNPAELIGSQALDELIGTAQEHYHIVLFDSSPVLEVTDARILANKCDGVILVLCNGKTKSEMAVEAKRLLELVKAKCIGAIFNQKSK